MTIGILAAWKVLSLITVAAYWVKGDLLEIKELLSNLILLMAIQILQGMEY